MLSIVDPPFALVSKRERSTHVQKVTSALLQIPCG